jgi:hypothetical protein
MLILKVLQDIKYKRGRADPVQMDDATLIILSLEIPEKGGLRST